MRLKILVVPFFLVITLILTIGYIKPDFDEILTRKADIAIQNDLVSNVDSTVENIAILGNSLDREKESEDFLRSYLPFTMDQEQTINTFSYLAAQSGLIISGMDLKKIAEIANIGVAPDGSIIENLNVSEVKTFQFTGNVLGSYENIKAFFNRLVHVNRFQSVQLFSIQKNDQIAISGNTTDLKGTFVVEYGYLPNKHIASALDMPVFHSSKLNFSEVVSLREKITSIPILEKGQSGKPNPFQ